MYVDDKFDGISLLKLKATLGCDDEKVIDVLRDSLAKAIEDFPSDLALHLSSNNMTQIMGYAGTIGYIEKATIIQPGVSGDIYAISWKANPNTPKHANFILNRVGLFLDSVAATDIVLQKDGVTVETIPITTIANKAVHKSTALTIPAFDEIGEPHIYTLLYEMPTGVGYYETSFRCGCGEKPDHDRHIEYGNYRGDGIGMHGPLNNRRDMYGLFFKMEISCGVNWLCNDWDFKSDDYARTMAMTIKLMAILNAHMYFLNSEEINAFKLNETEAVQARISELAEEIESRFNYLGSTLPPAADGCWKCKERMQVVTIEA